MCLVSFDHDLLFNMEVTPQTIKVSCYILSICERTVWNIEITLMDSY